MIGTGAIVHEVELPHPPERVWRALTSSGELSEWLMPTDFVAEVGARSTFRMGDQADELFHCEVTDVDPPHRLVYTWSSADLAQTTVQWRLTATSTGTRLHLEHRGFNLDDPTEAAMHRELDDGWRSEKLGVSLPALLNRMP